MTHLANPPEGDGSVPAVPRLCAIRPERRRETARLVLKQYSEGRSPSALKRRRRPGKAASEASLIWNAYCEGRSVAFLAGVFGRSPEEIDLLVTRKRVQAWKSRTIEYTGRPVFRGTDCERTVIECPELADPFEPAVRPPVHSGRDVALQQLANTPLLRPAGEVALFRKMNYLKYKADALRKRLHPSRSTSRDIRELESLLDEADQVRNLIALANQRLVVSIARKHRPQCSDVIELIGEANLALLRAVELFDFTRGFKFSTYAAWAIRNTILRICNRWRRNGRRQQSADDAFLADIAAPDSGLGLQGETEHLVQRMLATLSDRERQVLCARFGINGRGKARSRQQLASRIRISRERVRQIEIRALSKLRRSFEGEARALS